MNDRQRFHAVMQYQPVDRIPYYMVGPWDETLERWHAEGLPEDADPDEFLGITPLRLTYAGIRSGPWPAFEEKTLREDDEFRYLVDKWGRTIRRTKHTMSMPEWIEFPVNTPDELRRVMDERFDPDRMDQRWDGWEGKLADWKREDCNGRAQIKIIQEHLTFTKMDLSEEKDTFPRFTINHQQNLPIRNILSS